MGSSYGFVGLFVVMISMVILSSSQVSSARQFWVGGKDGWVVKPSEQFGHWAERNRFQVNDTLYFKYNKGSDSVLVVNKEDYDSCNTKNPISKMDGGDSTFKFDKSGPFFFISGNVENCQNGEKLIVVVLALSHHKHSAPAPSQSQGLSPPANSPVYPPTMGPSGEDHSPAPSPHSGSTRFGGSVGVGLGVGIAVAMLLA